MAEVPMNSSISHREAGEWAMPWNAQAGAGRLGPGVPKSDFWASAKEGIDSRGVTDAEFTAFVKSTYRVLLTRGLRGCYVYFKDAPTRDYFLSRTEKRSTTASSEAIPSPPGRASG